MSDDPILVVLAVAMGTLGGILLADRAGSTMSSTPT